jgi:secondary thiamine-phosphate synthase enzyme
MAKVESIRVRTDRRTQLVDVTNEVQAIVAKSRVQQGTCFVYVPHTTAGVTINEHADPDVATDVEGILDRLVPDKGPYLHAEGNSDSHAKTILTGTSQLVFVEHGRLVLGRWQGIFFCEYDGPRERTMQIKVVPDPVSPAK